MRGGHRDAVNASRIRRLLPLLATAVLSACGSSGSPSASSPSGGEDTRTASQIYDDFLTDMASERSVHVTGHQVDSRGSSSDIDVVDTQESASITISASGQTLYLVVTPSAVYAAESRSGPWTAAPADLSVNARSLTLASTVRCGRIEHGTLTKGSVSTVNGQRVIAVNDDGKAAGASPSTVYVTVSTPARLVRVVDHGATTPGGRADCGHAASPGTPATTSATFDFANWGATVTVTPPPSGGV
jgi:hypothetical protein